jgi:hypothetical protein
MSARRVCAVLAAASSALAWPTGVAVSVQARPAARATAGAAAAAGAPSVQSMVVGSGGAILSPARTVTASATTVRIGARSCAVAAGTPLAVLAAVRRAGGPGFALRDYGRCNSSPRNSGQLFVYSLAGEVNRGQSGWEYKVDGASGTTGAGDPSGPSGDGRLLRAGERVLWFWCQAVAGGCQRTLEVAPSSFAVSPGASLGVAVDGYENEGRAAPVARAIVTLGTDFASTGPAGRATLIAPSAPGRYQVSATRRGLVPSFPETIVVR